MNKLIIFIVTICLGCNKYAEKVDGTYVGEITINDSIVLTNANIKVSELSNKSVSIESSFFNTYELEIERQRYFGSVTYFNQGDSTTSLEIGETATGMFLTIVHYDELDNSYFFHGENY